MTILKDLLIVCLSLVLTSLPAHSCWRRPSSKTLPKKTGLEFYNPETDVALDDDRVWLFAVGGRRKTRNLIDENGLLSGFDVDLISAVCKVANKKCSTVLAQIPECTFTSRNINLAGRGLMSGWFDGCASYVISRDRLGAFDFTKPYLATDASFTVAPRNPARFDPKVEDYSKFTIVHLNGAVTNAQCLNRLGKQFGRIIIAKNLSDAKAKLLNREADVLFSPRSRIDGLEVLPERVHCEEGGTGIMTKKGSELKSWWDPAFSKFVQFGQYAKFCADSNVKYNANFRCLAHSYERVTPEQQIGKTWLFAVSGRRKPFNFLDENGNLVGHDVDFVKAVCQVAAETCDMVLTEFTECVFTNRNMNYAGRGISDGWFDACTGYVDSIDRRNNFDFTFAYLKSSSSFTVTPGNPSGFDPDSSDYSNFTFTHLTGAFTNAACLHRLKKDVKNVVIAANLQDAKRLLFDREADVLFSPRSSIPDLQTFPQRYQCGETGTTMMTRKGSPLVSWWNFAFETFVTSGKYQEQCQENSKKYNYTINCFTPTELAHLWDPGSYN